MGRTEATKPTEAPIVSGSLVTGGMVMAKPTPTGPSEKLITHYIDHPTAPSERNLP